MKIMKSLKNTDLWIKFVSETIKNEAKEQKGGFLSMLLDILRASLSRSQLTGKELFEA